MGNTWITDMRHFLDMLDPDKSARMPEPVLELGKHLGSIIEAVTAGWDDRRHPVPTTIPCRQSPGRDRCLGITVVFLADDGRIQWECTNCSDQGIISGWQGTPWDFSNVIGLGFGQGGKFEEIVVKPDEYRALLDLLPLLDREAERVVKAACLSPEDDEIVIGAPGDWLEHLLEYVAAEANHTRCKKTRRLLDGVLDGSAGRGKG